MRELEEFLKLRYKNFMKKLIRLTAFMTAVVLFTVSLPVKAGAETTSEKIKKAEELKKATEAKKEEIADKKEELEGERERLKGYLNQLNADLTDISENLDDLENRIDLKIDEIDDTQRQIDEAIECENKQYDLMKKRIKHIYESGDPSILTSFLACKSYAEFLNKAEYVNRTEEFDKKVFDNMIRLRKEVQEKKEVLDSEKAELEVLRAQAEAEQSKVSSIVSSTSGEIAARDGAISVAEIEEAAYAAEIEAQEQNLVALKKQLAEEQAMSRRAAQMAWRDVSELVYEPTDRDLLACLIYCEAGNQPYAGQVAVGAVVINRMRSAAFPNTMVGVIYQNRQFSPVASGRLAARLAVGANAQCYQAADDAMKGSTPVGNCLYFRTVIPEINGQIIGGHVFY